MILRLKAWLTKTTAPKDRSRAAIIGFFGGIWVGLLGRLIFGAMPVSFSEVGLYALGVAMVCCLLGIVFPKIVSVLLFPFSIFGIGGS